MNPNHLPSGYLLHQRYSIQRSLGQGGFGITYLAYDPVLAQEVCIKELFISGNSTRGTNLTVHSQTNGAFSFPDFVQRFIQEAQQLARFHHPNIVRVLDVFKDNQTAYMVMEFVPGETLKQKIQREGAINVQNTMILVTQLLDAVEEVHSKGMLHRDIKPENIQLSPEGRLVLIDFGSARDFTEGMTSTQTAMITPGYAPPEQYSNRAQRGPYTDIYSLGATLYYLLTGEKPIAATDRHLGEELKPPHELNSGIDPQISEAVIKAMELKPENRFQQVKELRGALNTMPKPQKPPEPPLPTPKPKNPKKNLLGVYVLLFILVIAAFNASNNQRFKVYVLLFILVIAAIYFLWPGHSTQHQPEADAQTIADSMMQAMEAEDTSAETADSQSNDEARKEAEAQRIADSIMRSKQAENTGTEETARQTTDKARAGVEAKRIIDSIMQAKIEAEVQVKQNNSPILQILQKDMVYVAGGTFTMGSDRADEYRSNERPAHQVSLNGYYIGKYEVTQAQWLEVMGNNPSYFSGCDNCPVEQVSWNDVQVFIRKLNQKTGKNFRLPTEAEWEYASRGGRQGRGYKYAGSDWISSVAWYNDNAEKKTHPVGQKSPNELGIYDLSGNVHEWCHDWYGGYPNAVQNNPIGPSMGSYRVFRGGSWINYTNNSNECRSTYRDYLNPDNSTNSIIGFRLAW